MVAPIIWAGIALGGILATGWTANQIQGATDSTTRLTKWAVVGGVGYVSFLALKQAGALK
jgi:hypothetical protein